MRRFSTREEVRQARLPPNVAAVQEKVLVGELRLAGPGDTILKTLAISEKVFTGNPLVMIDCEQIG